MIEKEAPNEHGDVPVGSFRRRYFAELEAKPEAWRPLLEAARKGDVTLLFSARDETHNNAVALKALLEARTAGTLEPG